MAKKAYNRKDRYYHKAKEEGFKSRAAYKLIQINKQYKLLKNGLLVVDLGSSPGSWLQVISKEIGSLGKVIGVDLEPLQFTPEKNTGLIVGDIREERTKQLLLAALGQKVDLVLSDMAPHLSGIKFQDHYNSYELAEQAFKICRTFLRENGNFVVKLFPGEELGQFRQNLKGSFKKIDLLTPDATRKSSTAIYVIARGIHPPHNH